MVHLYEHQKRALDLKAKIAEVEKQRHETKSWKRKKDLGKYLRKLHIELLKKERCSYDCPSM